MTTSLRDVLVEAFQDALRGLDLGSRTRAAAEAALARREPDRIGVLAVGKAAAQMASGALAAIAERGVGAESIVVLPDGTDDLGVAARPGARVLRAAHPVPDARSATAADAALRLAAQSLETDLLLVLVSGGASSLLAGPLPGVALEEMIAQHARLQELGLPVKTLNLVRRHFGRAHGGALRAKAEGRVVTLIVSDVIGGEPHEIGSGPSILDPSTLEQAASALEAAAPGDEGLRRLAGLLRETPKPGLDEEIEVIADPDALAAAVAAALSRRGIQVELGTAEEGPADEVAERRLREAADLRPGHARVLACEPTLRPHAGAGRGGRAGWTALRVGVDLPADVAFLAGASDGVDGSGAAGACVTRDAIAAAGNERARAALAAFDDATFHAAAATAIDLGGPTGLNLTDVHVLARGA